MHAETTTSYTPDARIGDPVRESERLTARVHAWLTVERVAYGGLLIIALALRLVGLGWSPLGPGEAQQAMPALSGAWSLPVDMSGVDPALYSLQRTLFTLFGASDFAACFWPVLLGGLAVLCFYAFRGRLGRSGALMAAALWAISPMAVFTSRLGYGDALVTSFALAAAAALEIVWRRAYHTSQVEGSTPDVQPDARRYVILAGIALGLMFASGGNAGTVLAMALLPALIWRDAARRMWQAVAPDWKAAAFAFGATFALSATFVFVTPEGLAAAAALPGEWVRDLIPWSGEYSAFELAGRLLMSDVVVLILGLVGLGIAVRRRNAFGMAAGLAAGVALIPVLLGRGRHPLDLVLVLLPLVYLAGPVGARVFENFTRWRSSLDAVLLAVVNAVLLIAAAFCLAGAFNPANTANWRQVYLIVGALTLILAVLQWFVYGVLGDWGTVTRVAPFVPLALGLTWMLSQSIGIAMDHGAWRQANPVHEYTGEGYADLAAELRNVTALNGRGDREVSIDRCCRRGAMMPWNPSCSVVARLSDGAAFGGCPLQPAPVVITAAEIQPGLIDTYGGADFSVLERWQPSMLDSAYARLRWVLFHEARIPPETTSAVLWVRRPLQSTTADAPALLDLAPEIPLESGSVP